MTPGPKVYSTTAIIDSIMSFMNLVVDYLFLLIDKDDNVDG